MKDFIQKEKKSGEFKKDYDLLFDKEGKPKT